MVDGSTDEFKAFLQVHEALVGLEDDAKVRVISSVSTLLGLAAPASSPPKRMEDSAAHSESHREPESEETGGGGFAEFAELYAKADPASQADKALVAGYWLQVCQGKENFSGQAVNTELNHLGHKIANITNAMTSLNDAKPQLVLQLRKSGKSQQARKTYKLSAAGIERVKDMIVGS